MNIPEERIHQKTEIRWLIEAGSPCFYMAPTEYTTTNAWYATNFPTKNEAEKFLIRNRPEWNKQVGEQDWRICDHMFYV